MSQQPQATQFSDTTVDPAAFYPQSVPAAFAKAGKQAAVIADPAAGATVDAEARAAINDIIDALQDAGIVATS